MSAADFFEWLGVLVSVPLGVAVCLLVLATAGFVYLDARERSNSLALAALLAVICAVAYWPLSFLAYLVGTNLLDRRAKTEQGV